jgi:peptidoglycan/xylan/chitin deacetylase (PgdA/CDA1 family)
MWDILSKDYDNDLSTEVVYANVIRNIRPGSIIVFHDSEKANKNLLVVLPRILEYLSQQGYALEAIPY